MARPTRNGQAINLRGDTYSSTEYLDLLITGDMHDAQLLADVSTGGIDAFTEHVGGEYDEFFTGLTIFWLGEDGKPIAEGFIQYDDGLAEWLKVWPVESEEFGWVLQMCDDEAEFSILIGVSRKLGQIREVRLDPVKDPCS